MTLAFIVSGKFPFFGYFFRLPWDLSFPVSIQFIGLAEFIKVDSFLVVHKKKNRG